ncbi:MULTISPECIES: mandelate racemase/muconate lactonizing enzyme family protein [unclassified Chelatococcus]|uniref:mandelate racemase/muconate lactonizing enzyme family protein n=1 Tax=unclassified Chelatococcus TaxID=2638111 RepID=UPI001BCCBFE8|nr:MULTISPECIES: mandelate racemase/muconate lactonizing enzyme family protein [unclassified Chelatococcus]MBS7700973.1 mandelate racemase/muconate lactonizing enzyme family protein [Chelatococcus sp. YT9]MBX3555506.1 mandelate racemase/muconate lactonizing enzyme family protein [Chelatococcus sp.]
MDGAKPLVIQTLHAHLVAVSQKTHWIIVELTLAEGTTGWGEATLAGAEEAVLAEIAHANTLLLGVGFAGPAEIVGRLRVAHASLARTIVMRAVEQAVLDALARRAGLSLAALLGGPERMSIPVYANINRGIADRSPAGFAARAREVVTMDGYTAVKIAPFDGLNWARADYATGQRLLADGIARIEAVREAIGPDAALLVDCHSRLSPVMAREALRAVDGASLFWFEEPLDEHAFDGETARALRSFANDRGVRIAGGEQLATMTEARDFLVRGTCDAILPDLRWTGLRSGLAILELAAASGVAVSLHNPVGPVLDRISLQMAAALPSFLILERQVRESPLFDEIRGAAGQIAGGVIAIDPLPGFGTEPDRQVLARHTTQNLTRPASLAGIAGAGGDA